MHGDSIGHAAASFGRTRGEAARARRMTPPAAMVTSRSSPFGLRGDSRHLGGASAAVHADRQHILHDIGRTDVTQRSEGGVALDHKAHVGIGVPTNAFATRNRSTGRYLGAQLLVGRLLLSGGPFIAVDSLDHLAHRRLQ